MQGRAGLPPKANAALGIVAWYAALCLSARLGWQGWLWGIPMLVLLVGTGILMTCLTK